MPTPAPDVRILVPVRPAPNPVPDRGPATPADREARPAARPPRRDGRRPGARAAFAGVCLAAGLAYLGIGAPVHADDPFGPVPPPGVRPTGPAAPAADDADRPADVAAYRAWLRRQDWLCRALAARELRLRSDDGVVSALATTLASEGDARVVGVVLAALKGRSRDDLLVEGGVALAERMVALLDHRHPVVRERALAAVLPLPPVRLPAEPARIKDWWARGRDGLAVEATLATERRAALRRAARGGLGEESKTVAPLAMRRYADLERIEREGLEVVVCLDQTGSMEAVIEAAKASIVRLVKRMKDLAPRFRVGLVTYDDEAFVRLPLTSDEAALEREFRRVHAAGGGDYEEGVDKALALAFEQRKVAWSRKALRVIVLVGDAPPHDDDAGPMMRGILARRDDPAFEAPVRIDTITTVPGARAPDDLVPYFGDIARAGRGAALVLGSSRDLAAELLLASFGAAWREPLRALLEELDAFDAAAAAR